MLDKLLLTYWYKIEPIRSDELITVSIAVMRYAPVSMFLYGGYSLYENYCMVENKPTNIYLTT